MKRKRSKISIWTGLVAFSVLIAGAPVEDPSVYAVSGTYNPSNAHLVITPTTADWTNKSITLTIKGSQNNGGISFIRLPNGNIVNGSTATFTVSENGDYPFTAQAENGQWLTGGYTVSNIEKVKPLIEVPNLPTDWANKNIEVKVNAK